jgi:hypothetical protein
MTAITDDEEADSNRVCFFCIGETYLKEEIKKNGKRRKCHYCGEVARTYSIVKLANIVEQAFDEHYDQTADNPDEWQTRMLADRESTYEWEREGEDVIMAITDAVSVSDEIGKDIQTILNDRYSSHDAYFAGEETNFQSGSQYTRKTVRSYQWDNDWRDFEDALKTKERYFSQAGANLLNKIFDGVEHMKTWGQKPLIIDAGPQTGLSYLHRARVFQSEHELSEALKNPDWQFGPPPPGKIFSGRMNAPGIAVFYGASTPDVAIAEVRPPVGSKVVVAKFDILKPCRLLDLTAFQHIMPEGSIFDPAFTPYLERLAFLSQLQEHMTRAVMPNDELLDYLPTQAVADFLAVHPKLNVDGIIYPSVQTKTKDYNCVLFHKFSRVERIALKPGTQLKSGTLRYEEDEWYSNYEITEFIPPDRELTDFEKEIERFAAINPIIDADERTSALAVDIGAIYVHSVESVQVKTRSHQTSRRQKLFLREEDLYDY